MEQIVQGISETLSNLLADLGYTIATAIFSFLFNICNVFLSAIFAIPNVLIGGILDDIVYSSYVTNFYSVLNSYIVPGARFFIDLVPGTI